MFGSDESALKNPLLDKGPKDPTKPSEDFSKEHDDVKKGRGRPRGPNYEKNLRPNRTPGPAKPAPESKGTDSPPRPEERWTPVTAGAFIQACHYIPVGLTGWEGWLYTPTQLQAAAPIAAEVFNEILPAGSFWVKLVTFAGVVGGIEYQKLREFKAWSAAQQSSAAPAPQKEIVKAPMEVRANGAEIAKAAPAVAQNSTVLPGSDMPVAPGVVVPKR